MLVQLLVILSDPDLRKRLRDLRTGELNVTVAERMDDAPALLDRVSVDILLTDRHGLGAVPNQRMDELRSGGRGPDVLYLATDESPDERARLLAQGCLAIIDGRAPEPGLTQAVLDVISKWREDWICALDAGRSPQDASELRPITAVALDGRLDPAAPVEHPRWEEGRRYRHANTFELGDGSTLFVFGFGAVVRDGADRIDGRLRDEIQAMLDRRFLLETAETHFIVTDPSQPEGPPRVSWDRIAIPEQSPELVASVALLLAQSVALERYELASDSLLEETLTLSRALASRGRLPLGTKRLVKRIGRLTRDRLELARWFYLVDRPEETWEDRRVARLYDALFENLELRQRHEAMLHKLGATERATQTAIEMWHGRRSNALEWAIVLLIVVEIVFGVWGVL